MSTPIGIVHGAFGRVALLDMSQPLVAHAHPQLHVLLKAGGADSCFEVRGESRPLADDTTVLVNAWERHAYVHRRDPTRAFVLALYVEPGWLRWLDDRFRAGQRADFFARPCAGISPRVRRLTRELAERLLGEQRERAEVEAAVAEVIVAIVNRHSDWRRVRGPIGARTAVSDQRIRRAVEQMRADPGRRLDIEALCRCACLSRAHFFERFRASTGLTPAMYANALRMEAALPRIADTRRPMHEIASGLGFPSQTQFTRFFRDHQGVSPSAYRHASV